MSQPHTEALQTVEILDQVRPQPLPAAQSVPIIAAAPVTVIQLPAKVSSLRSTTVPDTASERIVGSEPQRKRLVVAAIDQPVIIGNTHAMANAAAGNGGYVLPMGQQLELMETGPLFARSGTPGSRATVSIMTEDWTG